MLEALSIQFMLANHSDPLFLKTLSRQFLKHCQGSFLHSLMWFFVLTQKCYDFHVANSGQKCCDS